MRSGTDRSVMRRGHRGRRRGHEATVGIAIPRRAMSLVPLCRDAIYPTRQVVPPGRSSRVTPSRRAACGSGRSGRTAASSAGCPSRRSFASVRRLFRRSMSSCIRPATRSSSPPSVLPSAVRSQAEDLGHLLDQRRHLRRTRPSPPASLVAGSSSLPTSASRFSAVDQLEQHADRAAGVEVVVHVLEEPLDRTRRNAGCASTGRLARRSAPAARRTACR